MVVVKYRMFQHIFLFPCTESIFTFKFDISFTLKMEGKPIQIVVAKDDHTFELDEEALASIVCQDNVKDKHIAVISVAGAFRKGKSFLLDFFLRYLKANVSFLIFFLVKLCLTKGFQGSTDWLGPEDRPLTGFSWRGGCERDTTGILAWSEVLLVDTPTGEKVQFIFICR